MLSWLHGVDYKQENSSNTLSISCIRHKKTDENSAWGVSGFGPNDEKHFEEFKKLHETEIEKHDEDTLNVKDAYMKVLKQKSGYVRGLGPGARPPNKVGGTQGESNEVRVELSYEIEQLKDAAASRESQIDTLKASNDELRASNEELRASNEELKVSISKINLEAIEREKKLREDMQKMFDEMRYDVFLLLYFPPTLDS